MMTFSKIKKKTKLSPKPLKPKIQKNIKIHVRRPQIKKFRKQTIIRIEKIIRMTFFLNFKNTKISPIPPKNQ